VFPGVSRVESRRAAQRNVSARIKAIATRIVVIGGQAIAMLTEKQT